MFETETFGPYLVWKLKCVGGGGEGGGRGMASLTPQWLRPCHQLSGKISPGYRDEIATAWFYLQNLLALSRQG